MNSDIMRQENEKASSESLEIDDNNQNNQDSSKRKIIHQNKFKQI